jgi:toxin secretion/phage lysis holin
MSEATIYEFSQLWYYVMSFMLIDVLLGTLLALKNRELDSEESLNGGIKKGAIALLLVFTLILERAVGVPVFKLTCIFYMLYESTSIIENAGLLGLPLPGVIKRAVTVLQLNYDDNDDKTPKT